MARITNVVHLSLGPQQPFYLASGKRIWGWKIACAGTSAKLPRGHDRHSNFALVTCRYCLLVAQESYHQKIQAVEQMLEQIPVKQPRAKMELSRNAIMQKISKGNVDPEILERLRFS